MARDAHIESYDGPAGGWGSARSVTRALMHDGAPLKSAAALTKQNKPGGFACVSCACCAAYYPECNPLIPLWHHAKGSKVPAAKAVPVTLHP